LEQNKFGKGKSNRRKKRIGSKKEKGGKRKNKTKQISKKVQYTKKERGACRVGVCEDKYCCGSGSTGAESFWPDPDPCHG
jgi:hypothetical protein